MKKYPLDIKYELEKIWIVLNRHTEELELKRSSKQYEYQLKKHKENKCMICGKKDVFKAWRCKDCYIKRQLT